MVHHLEDRAGRSVRVEHEDPDDDQVHLGEARVGDDAASVGLAERDQRAVEEAGKREPEQQPAPVVRRPGKERHREGQEAVCARLRDDARQQRRHLGRRLSVGRREPAVQREERRLDAEGGCECEEQPRGLVRVGDQRLPLERAGRDSQVGDRHQHQQRSDEGVDDELHRRGPPPGPAPDAHQDVERDHHDLPAHVEEHQVLGGEEQGQRELEDEDQREVRPRALTTHADRSADRRGDADRGQEHHEEREAVHRDVVADRGVQAEVRDPVAVLHILLAAVCLEPDQRGCAQPAFGEREQEREALGQAARQRQRARGRVRRRAGGR